MALEDFFSEVAAVESWRARNENARVRASMFGDKEANRIEAAARLYPNLRPGALLALGRGGYKPEDPMTQRVAELSAQLDLREHPAGVQYGDQAIHPLLRKATEPKPRQVNHLIQTAMGGAQPAVGFDVNDQEQASLYQKTRDAGITTMQGLLVEPDEDQGGPKQFVFDEVVESMLRKGVKVPFIAKDGSVQHLDQGDVDPAAVESATAIHDQAADRAATDPRHGPSSRRTGWALGDAKAGLTRRTILEAPPTPDDGGGGGPGILDQARQLTGEEPANTPAEVQAAGIGDMALTTPVRMGFAAMDAPVQELQGQIRNLYGLAHGEKPDFWESQSDLGVALSTGADADAMGDGFFVDQESAVARERRRREAERGQIGGQNITLGRIVANGMPFVDPGERSYMVLSGLVDFGVQVADPVAFGLGKVGKARRGSQLFSAADEAAGGVRGLRAVVRPKAVNHWLDNNPEILSNLAAETSPYTIWARSNRKIPITMARRLADEGGTPADVRRILEDKGGLGTGIREVRAAEAMGSTGKISPISVMPARGKINAHDPDIAAFEVEATLRNAHVNEAGIRNAVDRVARSADQYELNAAIRRAIDDDLDGALVANGIEDKQLRRKLTALSVDAHEETSSTFRMGMAHQGPTDNPLMVAGEEMYYPGAHLMIEHAPKYMTMPDGREIRRLTSELPNLMKGAISNSQGELRAPLYALDWIQNRVWKPLQLMRPAWTVRVIAEEQVRMAAAGYDSMFKHPLSFVSRRIAQDSRTGKALSHVPGITPGKGGIDFDKGALLDDANELKDAMALSHGGWTDQAMVRTGVKTTFRKGHVKDRDRFNDSWASELLKLSASPDSQAVARAATLDDAYDYFIKGPGVQWMEKQEAMHPGRFNTLDKKKAYIDTVQMRIQNATGGNADLFDAIRHGKLDGEDLMTGTGINHNAARKLDGYHDEFAPEVMIGEESRAVTKETRNLWDKTIDSLFGALMTNRTNNLSRIPTFKQEYWREGERLIQFVSPQTKTHMIQKAREAGVGSRAIRRMERVQAKGALNPAEADLLAKGQALEKTKDLLYDLTRRGRFMDANRLVAPFGEAWSEVMTRWLHPTDGLVASNPKVVRRFQQVIQGARGEDFGDVMGAPEGEGFFWKNEFGDEVFVIPGSQILTEWTTGVPIPMSGSVKGLSMFGTVIPGLGPVLQIPTGWIVANKPGPQFVKEILGDLEMAEMPVVGGTVRDQITPFGSIGVNDQGDVTDVRNFLPTWMRTAIDVVTSGDGNEQQYGNAIKSIMAYKRSTGDYGNTKAELQRLAEDSADVARKFTLIRALGQSVAPSSPSPDWLVVDKNDKTVRLRAMAAEYRRLQDEDYDTADQKFVEAHHDDMLAAVQSQSAGVEYAVPTTREGAQWVLENPGIEDALPHTYGFFAPQGGDMDYTLYSKQFLKGDRADMSPDEFNHVMSNKIAGMHYRNGLEEVGEYRNTDEGRQYLRDLSSWIYDKYETWKDETGMPKRPETEVMVRELLDARNNETVANTDAGKGLALYLDGRDEVMEWMRSENMVRSDGLLSSAEGSEEAHRYLWELADYAMSEHPGFESLFDIVLSRELEVPEDGA